MRSALFGAGRTAASVLATALCLHALPTAAQEAPPAAPSEPSAPAPSAPPDSAIPPEQPEAPVTLEPPPGEAPAETPPPAAAEPPAPTAAPVVETTETAPVGTTEVYALRSAIVGRVVDASTGIGMIEAPVIVEGGGRRRRVQTDLDGNFTVEVPPGTYSIRSFYDLYVPERITGVRVRRNARTEIVIELAPTEAAQEQEVVIIAQADVATEATQLQARREAAVVRDAISQQEVRRNADATAASAVRRVVGASIEGSNLIVRGLASRYTAVLLNGAQLPSTDPDNPGVQLDLIPTALVANLAIAKTFTPDLPAFWAGGLMMIDSVQFPERFTLTARLNLGANTNTTFQNGLAYDGSRTDWLGWDNGTRALPSDVPASGVLVPQSVSSTPELQQIVDSFSHTWGFHNQKQLPNMNLQLTIGDSFNFRRGRKFGYVVALNYTRQALTVNGQSNVYSNYVYDDPSATQSLIEADYTQTTTDTLLSVLGTATYRYSPRGEIRLVTMFSQSSTDWTRFQSGLDNNSDVFAFQQWQLGWVQRSVSFFQLTGEQREIRLPPGSKLTWSLYGSTGSRYQPDTRQYGAQRPQGSTDPYIWLGRPNFGDRWYYDLKQWEFGGFGNYRMPLWDRAAFTLGGQGKYTQRTYSQRDFRFLHGTEPDDPNAFYSQAPADVFVGANTGAFGDLPVTFQEFTGATSGYDANQLWLAGYGMLETPIYGGLRFVGGVRAEAFRQDVLSENPLDVPASTTPPAFQTNRTDVNWLPGATLVYELPHQMFLRAAYGMTVARPQFRELASFSYYDFARRRNINGNPDLVSTVIQNVDLRFEWFPSDLEVLAVSLYYKKFTDPIERVLQSSGSTDLTFANAAGAYNYGIELEARVGLDRIHRSLRWFSLNGNLALIKSRVELDGNAAMQAANPNRPMYYQSPYVANLSLRFDHPDSGVQATLIYNVVGPRISDVGLREGSAIQPDIYEQQFNSLDFNATWQINDPWQLRFGAKNLLNQARRWKQGDLYTDYFKPGYEFFLGAGYTY